MPRCKVPAHTIPLNGANDNYRVEPNTAVLDEDPVPMVQADDSEGVSIVTIALIASLIVAVVYLVYHSLAS